jgi:hypothetical protein
MVDVLFQAFPMVPLLCRSNLADGTFQCNLKEPCIAQHRTFQHRFNRVIPVCEFAEFHLICSPVDAEITQLTFEVKSYDCRKLFLSMSARAVWPKKRCFKKYILEKISPDVSETY